MVDLRSRLPELSDDALATLRGNAERLSREGTDKQRAAADALLPAVLNEIAGRTKEKNAARQERARQRKRTKPA